MLCATIVQFSEKWSFIFIKVSVFTFQGLFRVNLKKELEVTT